MGYNAFTTWEGTAYIKNIRPKIRSDYLTRSDGRTTYVLEDAAEEDYPEGDTWTEYEG